MLKKAILMSLLAIAGGAFPYAVEAETVPVMVEKNLFSQDRRPPAPDSAGSPAQPDKAGISHQAVQLDGVMIAGDSRKALLRLKTTPPGSAKKKGQSPFITVREGQRFSDYLVVKIEPKSISMEKDGQVFVVNLFAEGKVVTPLPAAPPPPPASVGQPGRGGQPAPPNVPGQGPNMGQRQPPNVPEGMEGAMAPGWPNPNMMTHQADGDHARQGIDTEGAGEYEFNEDPGEMEDEGE